VIRLFVSPCFDKYNTVPAKSYGSLLLLLTTAMKTDAAPAANLQRLQLLGSDVPPNCLNDVPVMIGIDEAGRGPVMGPMVYGAAYWPVADNDAMSALGFDDSKALSAESREGLFDKMKANGELGYNPFIWHCLRTHTDWYFARALL
jgi:ribonuclease HIII